MSAITHFPESLGWLRDLWASTYGAYVAVRVREFELRGDGSPTREQYETISDDAATVADGAVHAYEENVRVSNIK